MIITTIKNYFEKNKLKSDTRFTDDQLVELYTGIKNCVNISRYKDPKLNADQMKIIRQFLERGVDISKSLSGNTPIYEFSCDWLLLYGRILEEYNKLSSKEIQDFIKCLRIPYTLEEISIIFDCILSGVPSNIFYKTQLNKNQIILIKNGLHTKYDIIKYGHNEYDDNQMNFIVDMLSHDIDIDSFDVRLYSSEKLSLIADIAKFDPSIFEKINKDSLCYEIHMYGIALKNSAPELIDYYNNKLLSFNQFDVICSNYIILNHHEYDHGMLCNRYIYEYSPDEIISFASIIKYASGEYDITE